jgi:hypothetical protein
VKAFRLAPMSPVIAVLTAVLLLLPVVFVLSARFTRPVLLVPGLLLAAMYLWIWLWFRPTRFEWHADRLDVVWPLRREAIARGDIASVRVIDAATLKRDIGWGLRVGAGGLWGGFGWLYTQHRGKVRMYVSRTDRFVWLEPRRGPPWLLTPDDLDAFVAALSLPGTQLR